MKWLVPLGVDAGQGTVLVCVPYAGGGAMVFRDLKALSDRFCVYAVRAPGRETRMAETPLTDVGAMADGIDAELAPLSNARRVIVFGHSLGASVAFELARRTRDRGQPLARLVVSGRRPPTSARMDPPVAHLPRQAFLDKIAAMEGTPPAFFAHEELVELMLPLLRADFAAAESYVASPAPPLPCPILAYAGSDDKDPTPDEMRGWAQQTSASFSLRVFSGGHFYLHDTAALMMALREDLP